LENPSVNHGGIYFIRYEIERYVNAILCLQSILIDLNELGNYFSNGAALFCLKKFEDAIQYFNDAIENNPDFKKAIKSRKIDFKIDVKKR
jgi:tetratricopeptide (TPR) repeat protein